jgi:hypothetical protein
VAAKLNILAALPGVQLPLVLGPFQVHVGVDVKPVSLVTALVAVVVMVTDWPTDKEGRDVPFRLACPD